MRIAALFMPSPSPPPPPNSQTQPATEQSLPPSNGVTQSDLSSPTRVQPEAGSAEPTAVHHAGEVQQPLPIDSVRQAGSPSHSSEGSLEGSLHTQAESASRHQGCPAERAADVSSQPESPASAAVLTESPQSAASDTASSTTLRPRLVPDITQTLATRNQESTHEELPQASDVSEHSKAPLTSPPLSTLADQGLLSAIQTPLGSPGQGIHAKVQAAASVAYSMTMPGITDSAMVNQGSLIAPASISAASSASTKEAEPQDRSQSKPCSLKASDIKVEPEAEPCTPKASDIKDKPEAVAKRKEQFSLEIVRCKIVCPAKVDAAGFTSADPSPLDHTLYMEIPHFLLQLPLSQPAQHPRPHPVDLNIRHVIRGQQAAVPAPDSTAPSPFAAAGQQGTIFSLTNLALFVALPEEFEAAHLASSSASHAQLPPFLSIPTASMSAVLHRAPPQHSALHSQIPNEPVPTFELEVRTAELVARPAQLQTMSASTIRYSSEMDIILGKAPSDRVAPVLAATADPSLDTQASATEADRVSSGYQQTPLPGSVKPGFAVEASVGLMSLQLHSSNNLLPALVLQWQRLSGHYSRATGSAASLGHTACAIQWHYLALQLTENPAEPQQQFSLEHVGTLRSGSLALPGRMSRVHSEPLGGHGPPSFVRSSRHGSGRLTRGTSVHGSSRRHTPAQRAMSPEEEFMTHQHSTSRLYGAPFGNGRSGLGLAELAAADEDASSPSSPPGIVNNRARLVTNSFAEAVEGILPSLSALSLGKASQHQQDGSDNASSSVSGSHSRSHRHRGLDHVHSLTRGTSVASSSLSIEELQRQVPVIRHRSVMVAPMPSTPLTTIPDFPTFASANNNFNLSSAFSSHSSRPGPSVFHDAPETPSSTRRVSEGGEPLLPGGSGAFSKEWSANELPPGDRLLLLLGSKGCFVASQDTASPSIDASVGCSLRPVASEAGQCSPAQSALEMCATDMLLRVYLEVSYKVHWCSVVCKHIFHQLVAQTACMPHKACSASQHAA